MLGLIISNQNQRFRRPAWAVRACASASLAPSPGGALLAFIVNSSPGPGLRFEPSKTLADMKAALDWAEGLSRRGMRLIRIRDTDTGRIFDERELREEIKRQGAS